VALQTPKRVRRHRPHGPGLHAPGSLRPLFSRKVLLATVPPLASIFGSGFLIIIPVLERTLGGLAIVGIAGVCGFAWLVGTAIRHNVRTVEPLDEENRLDRTTHRLEEAADLAIVAAYVISVALYLRIMAEYVVEYASSGSDDAERLLASGAVLLILGVGIVRGFAGLDMMERAALIAVLVLTTVLGGALFFTDVSDLLGGGVDIPSVPDRTLGNVLLVLGGIVITVQGFETVRYLGAEYDRETRVWACRLSQLVSSSIYLGFVLVATPLMGTATGDGPDDTLIDITARVVPLLSLPIVLTAVLSQFSAATADTVAAHGNMQHLAARLMRDPRAYIASGVAALIMIWSISTFTLIVVASRAFALYYALQCVVALRTANGLPRKLGYGALAVVLAAITLFAKPAG
jgi:hypothetical protein